MFFGGLFILGGFSAEHQINSQLESIDYGNRTQLAALWKGRVAGQPYFLAGEACWAFGWLLLITPIQALASLLGGDQRSGTMLLRICFFAPAMVNIVDFTFQAGTLSVTDTLSKFITGDPNYDPNAPMPVGLLTPLQTLELTYRVARSRSLWLSALVDACVTVGFAATAFLSFDKRHTSLCGCFKALTYVNILVAFGGFVSGVARGVEFGSAIGGKLRPINGVWFLSLLSLLLPAWLVALGHQVRP